MNLLIKTSLEKKISLRNAAYGVAIRRVYATYVASGITV